MDGKVYYPHYLYLLLYRVSPQAMSSESPVREDKQVAVQIH